MKWGYTLRDFSSNFLKLKKDTNLNFYEQIPNRILQNESIHWNIIVEFYKQKEYFKSNQKKKDNFKMGKNEKEN
jgi:hypothetical protein